jgi:hypothetical protein
METAGERHGNSMGTAGKRHGNGMVCVNPPLDLVVHDKTGGTAKQYSYYYYYYYLLQFKPMESVKLEQFYFASSKFWFIFCCTVKYFYVPEQYQITSHSTV